ncbi:MAG: Flp family type IVb pilin [Alphaproteobacteria bacterium]|nr:Flp family type IVb pilin [Alphaproteobacteria bacterium]
MGKAGEAEGVSHAAGRCSAHSCPRRAAALSFAADAAATTAVEYAIIAAGISLVIVAAVNALGNEVLALFQAVQF